MLVLIWNCRGAGKRGLAPCLKDLLVDYSVDFVGLQEKMIKNWQFCVDKI